MFTQLSTSYDLISLYIPPRRPIAEVIEQLRGEHIFAQNIKSDLTRNNIQNAISKIIEYLKLLKETPQNGLAVFCGDELFSVSPSKPIEINLYRCDDHFWTDGLNR